MALHTPVHQIGTTPHPHVLRDALIVVGVAAAVVALVALLLAVRPLMTTTSTAVDQLTTPQLVEFRAGERASWAVTSLTAALRPAADFRAGERDSWAATTVAATAPQALTAFRAGEREAWAATTTTAAQQAASQFRAGERDSWASTSTTERQSIIEYRAAERASR